MKHNGTIEWAPPPSPMVETIRETIRRNKFAQACKRAIRDLRDEWETLGDELHKQGESE